MTVPLYNLTDSWTADASDAILMNATTNTHTGNLLRLQADSTTVFQVDKAGKFGDAANFIIKWDSINGCVAFRNLADSAYVPFQVDTGNIKRLSIQTSIQTTGNEVYIDVAGDFQTSAGIYIASTAMIGFSSTTSGAGTLDTGISRSAAGVIALGNGTAGNGGACILAKTKAGAPTTSDVPSGAWALIRDTTNNTTKLYYNNAGTLQAAVLT